MKGLLEQTSLSDSIQIDSAGTGAWHSGEKADARSREVAKTRGLRLTSRARQFKARDFDEFDYVLAMDSSNYSILKEMTDARTSSKLYMFRSFDPATPEGPDVPDPYYGGAKGFENVFDICQAACEGLLEYLKKNHDLS